MDHAITIGNVLVVCGVLVGFILLVGGFFLLLDLMNPISERPLMHGLI